jgi:tetratricopeptide (TPR) repeat protein
MRRRLSILLAGLCLLATAGDLRAQGKKPTPAEIEQAKQHFKRATAHKDLGQYAQAAAEYLAAHALFPDPEFYFNAGEAYRLAGDAAHAIEYFEKYLAEAPRGRVATAARQSLAELAEAAVIQRQAEEEARRKAEEETRRKAEEEAQRKAAEEEARRQAEQAERQRIEEEARRKAEEDLRAREREARGGRAATRRPGRPLRLAGLGTAAVGLLAVGVGVKFGLDARRLSDEVSGVGDDAGDAWTEDNLDKISRGESAETKMMIFTGLGATALVAGGALYFLGHRKDARASRLTLTPAATPAWTGLALSGRF